jgi:outer membrane immunogenic protein
MRRFLLIGAIALLSIGAASAADFPYKAIPATVAPISNWSGPYVGLSAGYGWGDVRTTSQSLTTDGPGVGLPAGSFKPASTFTGLDAKQDMNGAIAGGFAGYNYQIGKIVVGGETEAFWSNFRADNAFSGSPLGPQYATRVRGDYGGDTVARLGYDLGNFLPYIKGGVAYQHFSTALSDTPGPKGKPSAPTLSASSDKWQIGSVVGAGLDYKIAPNILVGVDYSHFDYGNTTYTYALAKGTTASARGRVTEDVVRVRIGYQFSGL